MTRNDNSDRDYLDTVNETVFGMHHDCLQAHRSGTVKSSTLPANDPQVHPRLQVNELFFRPVTTLTLPTFF